MLTTAHATAARDAPGGRALPSTIISYVHAADTAAATAGSFIFEKRDQPSHDVVDSDGIGVAIHSARYDRQTFENRL